MPDTPTPVLGLIVPTVNGDEDSWGGFLNADLETLDTLGAFGVADASSNFLMVAGNPPEAFYRITTGGGIVTGTLPDPGTIPTGKVFTVKILDVGSVSVVCVNPAVTIDGIANYLLTNQFSYVRLLANGATYDVVGNN